MSNSKHNYRISSEVKEQVLKRIKEEGVSVTKASEEHGISTHTIYRWLTGTVANNPTIKEFNKVRKQNQELLALVGELTIKLSQTQKKI
ncbi:MAG: transposase [Patescibacteria group bacterium]